MLIAVIKMIIKNLLHKFLTLTNENSPHLCPMKNLPIYTQ